MRRLHISDAHCADQYGIHLAVYWRSPQCLLAFEILFAAWMRSRSWIKKMILNQHSVEGTFFKRLPIAVILLDRSPQSFGYFLRIDTLFLLTVERFRPNLLTRNHSADQVINSSMHPRIVTQFLIAGRKFHPTSLFDYQVLWRMRTIIVVCDELDVSIVPHMQVFVTHSFFDKRAALRDDRHEDDASLRCMSSSSTFVCVVNRPRHLCVKVAYGKCI